MPKGVRVRVPPRAPSLVRPIVDCDGDTDRQAVRSGRHLRTRATRLAFFVTRAARRAAPTPPPAAPPPPRLLAQELPGRHRREDRRRCASRRYGSASGPAASGPPLARCRRIVAATSSGTARCSLRQASPARSTTVNCARGVTFDRLRRVRRGSQCAGRSRPQFPVPGGGEASRPPSRIASSRNGYRAAPPEPQGATPRAPAHFRPVPRFGAV